MPHDRVYIACFTNLTPLISSLSIADDLLLTRTDISVNGSDRKCCNTILQNYMKNKKQFPHAIVAGFTREYLTSTRPVTLTYHAIHYVIPYPEIVMLVLYLTVAVGGFILYGADVKPNVLENLPASVLKTLIGVLMAFHVLAAMLIVINPVNLIFEQTIGIVSASG